MATENNNEAAAVETVTEEQIGDMVAQWGGDYLPLEDNPPSEPMTLEAETPVKQEPKKAKEPQGEVSEPKTTEEPKKEAKADSDASEPKQEPKAEEAKVEPKEEPKEEHDADTKRRLAIIDRREAQFRQREKETKAAIEAQVKKLEELYAEVERREAEQAKAARAAKEQFRKEPLRLLQEHGLSFEELAVANLKAKNLPIPQELDRLARQAAAADPLKPAILKEELGDMIDQRLNKILERLDSRDNQSQQAYQQQQQQLVYKDMERAVGHVQHNADNYPFLSTYLKDPENLAQQMLAAREELYAATGRDSDIGTVARYIENRYSEQFHPAFERIKAPKGQPQSESGNQASPAARRTGDQTLSNEAGSSKVSSAPVDMDEAYEMSWKQAPAILRGG